MKKCKKALSLLLASVMAISALTVGLSAFAASDEVVTKMEEAIRVATAWSDELAKEWKALTEEQQDAVKPQCHAKIINFAWIQAGGTANEERQKKAGELLGGYTPKTQTAMDTAKKITGYGKHTVRIDNVDTVIDLDKGGWKNKNWNYTSDYTYKDGADTVTITVAQQKEVYKAIKAEFDALTPAQQGFADHTASKSNYVQSYGMSRLNVTSILMDHYVKQIPALLTENTPEKFEEYFMKNFGFCEDPAWNVKKAIQTHLDFRDDIYIPFMAIENPTEAQDNAYVADYEKFLVEANDTTSIVWAAKSTRVMAFALDGKMIALEPLNNNNFKKAYDLIIGRRKGYEFNKKLESITIPANGSPEFNKTIDSVQAEYSKLNQYAKKIVILKYYDVIGKWVNDGSAANENTHVLPEQVKVESQAPEFINNILQESLESVIDVAASGLEGMIAGVFTNDLLSASFLSSIDIALGSEMSSLKFSPDKLASLINADEVQFAKAKAELAGKTDWADVGKLDWGVIPGDYETFSKALCAALRGVLDNVTLSMGGLEKVFLDRYTVNADGSVATNGYVFGLYGSVIIPVLEMFGVTDMISSFEYTQRVNKMTADIGHKDGYLKVMLDEIYYKLFPKIMENPSEFILQSLPNLVYHLEDGCIFKDVESSLQNAPLLATPIMGLINPYMSLEKIWELLTQPGTAADGTVTAPVLDLETLGINLTLEDITNIAHLGKAEIADTECKKYQSRVNITADKQSIKNYLINLAMGITSDLGISLTTDAVFVKQEVAKYPHDGKMDKKAINNLINGLEETVGGFINIEDAINGALATNEMAGTAIMGIYNAINGLVSQLGIQPIAPSRVGKMLGEAKEFKGLTAELKDIATWDEVSFTIKNDDGEVIKQVDMGFKDGDFDGFVKTIVASIRPLVDEIQKTGLLTNRTVDGETVYGLYETLIIPVLESIGLKPVATSATYTDNFNKLYAKNANEGLDYLVNTILKPVLTLLEKVEKNPIATIMEVLPNIAYALKYNPTTAFVGNLLLGDKNLADVLGGLISGIAVVEEEGKENLAKALTAFKEGLKLNPINLDALISCGEIKEVNSMSALNKTYTTVVADKADTFVTAFYYLFDTINTGDNLKLIKDLLANIEMDAGVKTLVDGLVNSLFDMTREEALCTIGATFSDWTCPNAEEGTGGNKGTNGKTPGTGDTAVSAIAVTTVLFTAGAAIVLLRKKKTIAE